MILVDENVPASTVAALLDAGFDVVRVGDVLPGANDEAVLAYAVQSRRVVLTQGKDFGDLVHVRGLAQVGVVLVRLRGMPFAERARRVVALFEERSDLVGSFSVLSNGGVRVRSG